MLKKGIRKIKKFLDDLFRMDKIEEIEIIEQKNPDLKEHEEEVVNLGNKKIIRKYKINKVEGEKILKQLIRQIETQIYENDGVKRKDYKLKALDEKGKLKTRMIKRDITDETNKDVFKKQTKVTKFFEKGKVKKIETDIEHNLKEDKKVKKIKKETNDACEGDELVYEYKDGELKHKKICKNGKLTGAYGKYEPYIEIDEGDGKISFRFHEVVDGKSKGIILSTGQNKDHVFKNVNDNIHKLKEVLGEHEIEIHEESHIAHIDDDEKILGTLKYIVNHMIFDDIEVFLEEEEEQKDLTTDFEEDEKIQIFGEELNV